MVGVWFWGVVLGLGWLFFCLFCVMVCLLKLRFFGGWSGGVLFFGVVKVMFWGVLVFGWRCYSFEGDMM